MTGLLPPIAQADAASAPFFEALAEGRVVIQRCQVCATAQLGQYRCVNCRSDALAWITVSGVGSIHSFTRIHLAYHPYFADHLPYAAGVIALAEGPRLYARIEGAPIHIDAPGTLRIDRLDHGVAVPVFYLDPTSEG